MSKEVDIAVLVFISYTTLDTVVCILLSSFYSHLRRVLRPFSSEVATWNCGYQFVYYLCIAN